MNSRRNGAINFPGTIYEKPLSTPTFAANTQIDRIDKFEDDFYQRQAISIDCDDGQRRMADAYIVPPANRDVLTDEPWDAEAFVAGGGLEHFIDRFAGFSRIAESD